MKPILMTGITIVNLALVFYSIAMVTLIRTKCISKMFLSFLTIGVFFDITATICMMIGSSKGIITIHGVIGYSSLLGMLIDTIFSFRHSIKSGINSPVSRKLLRYSLTAYLYWIAAYITGSIIIMMR